MYWNKQHRFREQEVVQPSTLDASDEASRKFETFSGCPAACEFPETG